MKTYSFSKMLIVLCMSSSIFLSCSSNNYLSRKNGSYVVAVRNVPWNMTFPDQSLTLENENIKPDGSGAYYMFSSKTSGLNVSFFIERAVNCTDSKQCRDDLLKKSEASLKKVKNLISNEIGDWAVSEYLIPEYGGIKINQQNMYAEYVRDGFWIDMHLSKVLYEDSQRELFVNFLHSISFQERSPDTSETTK